MDDCFELLQLWLFHASRRDYSPARGWPEMMPDPAFERLLHGVRR